MRLAVRVLQRLWRSTFGLAALASLVFAVTVLVIGTLVYEIAHEALEQQLDERVIMETRALIGGARGRNVSNIAGAVRARSGEANLAGLRYLIVDAENRRLAGSLNVDLPERTGLAEISITGPSGRVVQALITPLNGGARLVVAADRDVIEATDAALWRLFAIAFGITVVLGIGAASTVGAVTRARLRRLDRAARAVIAGDTNRRMPIDGSASEFDQLSATLNEMLDRIGSLIANLRHVSSDIAHDLRTPLTRLQNRLNSALVQNDPCDRRGDISAAHAQAGELLEIFAAMLRISEVEALGIRERFTNFDLSTVTAAMVETYEPELEARGSVLRSHITPDLNCRGDRRLWQQLVANLLDNVMTHTPAGTSVLVTLTQAADARRIYLEVCDDGPGVPIKDLASIFQRFRRSETSRTTTGHGLGLSLVQAIATAHRGVVSAHRTNPGLSIRVSLPDAPVSLSAKT